MQNEFVQQAKHSTVVWLFESRVFLKKIAFFQFQKPRPCQNVGPSIGLKRQNIIADQKKETDEATKSWACGLCCL